MPLRTEARGYVACWFALGACLLPGAAEAQSADAADANQPAPETATAARAQPFQMSLQVGLGVTQRAIDLPTEQGRVTLGAGFSPAFDVRASGRLALGRAFLRARVGYQSSLAIEANDRLRLITSGPASTPVRSHRLEGGLASGLWFDLGPGKSTLSLYLAYALRAFSSVQPLLIPSFTLHGPLLRIEVDVPLVRDLLWIQIAPEAQLIWAATHELRRSGGLRGTGFAYGGEAGLYVRLQSWIGLRLNYRESHAQLASVRATDRGLEDVERYFIANALFKFD
jgi:hypothetical protein